MENEEYMFRTREDVEAAKKIADEKWKADPAEYSDKELVVFHIRKARWSEGMITELGDEELTGSDTSWIGISEDNEFMLTNDEPEWVCIV